MGDASAIADALKALDSAVSTQDIEHGVSLLTVKAEMMAAYMQHLMLVMLAQLRGEWNDEAQAAIDRLIMLRLYMEKGVRPLEARLKYQTDKLVRAATRAEQQAAEGEAAAAAAAAEASAGPKPEQFADSDEEEVQDGLKDQAAAKRTKAPAEEDGIYRPPRIAAVRPDSQSRRPRHVNQTVRDYVRDMSDAPVAEPSVGSNIVQGGRAYVGVSERERRDTKDRERFEEENYTRLAEPSKKERRKLQQQRGRRDEIDLGGEDWRILNSYGGGGGSSGSTALERSKKRRTPTDLGGDDEDTSGHGRSAFERKRRAVERKLRRKRT